MGSPFLLRPGGNQGPLSFRGFIPAARPRPSFANRLINSLIDGFDGAGSAPDPNRWSVVNNGHTITQSGGDLVITPLVNYSPGAYSSAICLTNEAYDLTNDYCVISISDLSGMPDNEEMHFGLTNGTNFIGYIIKPVSGTTTLYYYSDGFIAGFNFDSTTMGWLAWDYINPTTIKLLTAPPSTNPPTRGSGSWTDRIGPWSLPGTLLANAVKLQIEGGSSNNIASGSTPIIGYVHSVNTATSVGMIYNVAIAAALILFGAVSEVSSYKRSISGLLEIENAISRLIAAARSFGGLIAISGSQSNPASHPRSIGGSLAIFGNLKASAQFARSLLASIIIFGSRASQGAYGRAIAGALSLLGSIKSIAQYARGISGSLFIRSSASAFGSHPRSISGGIAIFGSIQQIKAFARNLGGLIVASGRIAEVKTAPRSISGSLALSSSLSAIKVRLQALAASLALFGSSRQQLSALRAIAGQISLAGSLARIVAAGRSISGRIALQASSARILMAARIFEARIIIAGSCNRALASGRAIRALLKLAGNVSTAASSQMIEIAARIVLAASAAKGRSQAISGRIAAFGSLLKMIPQRIMRFSRERIAGGWGFRRSMKF